MRRAWILEVWPHGDVLGEGSTGSDLPITECNAKTEVTLLGVVVVLLIVHDMT
jgi:hypothetical protein